MTETEALQFIQKAESLPTNFHNTPLYSLCVLLYLYVHEYEQCDVNKISKELNIPAYTLYKVLCDKHRGLISRQHQTKAGAVHGSIYFYTLTREGKQLIEKLFNN